jgi:hypothetical protein
MVMTVSCVDNFNGKYSTWVGAVKELKALGEALKTPDCAGVGWGVVESIW